MFVEQKKQKIVELMNKLKDKNKQKFGSFLAKEFTDDDLRELTMENADKLLAFLTNI